MVVINVAVTNCQPQTIVIGRRGTYDTMQIAFDLSNLIDAYGNGVAVLAVKRSQDESAYPAVTTQADNTLTWTVSETDTAYVGAGECQLMWYVDGGLAKTIIYPMVVMRDILQTAEQPPDGYENWIEHLTELGAETQQNAQNAAQSASDAEQSATDAGAAKDAANEAVLHYPKIENGYWYVWDVTAQAYQNTNIKAEGDDGYSPEVTITSITGGHRVIITDKDHPQGQSFDVMDGQGGGTSNYADLSNKPKINNVELNGNKTAHDLGLAAQSDIPTVPVQSVNGKTGAVNLGAGDVGFDGQATYEAGSVGYEVSESNRHLSDVEKNQIPELKNAISVLGSDGMTPIFTWEQGSISNGGAELVSSSRVRTAEYIPIYNDCRISLTIESGYNYEVDYYDAAKIWKIATSWLDKSIDLYCDGTYSYVRLILRKSDNTDITPSEAEETGNSVKLIGEVPYDLIKTTNEIKSTISEYFPKSVNGLYINASYVMTAETSAEYSKVLILPIKPNHKYLLWFNTGNRWTVGLGNIYDIYSGYECEVGVTVNATFVGASVINNTNSKKFAYVYYYNGDTDPNSIYELIDITELNPSDWVTFKGVIVTSNGVRPPTYDTETISIPLVPNKDYVFKVWGGNRRNIALGSKQFPEVGDTITLINSGASTSPTTIRFNSGNHTYLYAYYLTIESAQDYPARFELIPEDDELVQIYRYTDYHTTSSTANTGDTFVVGEYNVAKYNNDTNVFISSEKLHNLKSTIAEINADVLFINEDLGYIDANDTKSSLDYVFMPVYPYRVGSNREKIYSKVPFATSQNKTSPNSRAVTFATITRNTKTILLVCVHAKPGITAADVTARQEDLAWLIGEINNMTFDYLIMGGDFNPEAGDDDLTIMENSFSNANMLMCNGGRFDYLNTWFDPFGRQSSITIARQMPLDYIITSNNVICNRFKVYTEEWFNLYSDHTPIVANLTLLETT